MGSMAEIYEEANMTSGIKHRLCYKPKGKSMMVFEYDAVDYFDAIKHGKLTCEVLEAEFYSVEQVVERRGKKDEN